MEFGSTNFFRLIFFSDCSVGAQIFWEGKMPVNLRRAMGVKMKLVLRVLRIRLRQAALTELRKLLTSALRRLLSAASIFAADST